MKNFILIMTPFALVFALVLALGACTTVRPGPEVFQSAENAIATAENAGADEHAPVEIRRAREKLSAARSAMEKRNFDVVLYRIDESEINAEAAIELTRTALARRKVNELRRTNEVMLEEMQNNFGEAFQ